MGIQQRRASSGDIAKAVGITINTRIPSRTPISNLKKGDIVSKTSKYKSTVRRVGRPDPVRAVVDSIIPGAAFLPGGGAADATQLAIEHPDIIAGSIIPIIPVVQGPLGTPGYVASKSYNEMLVQKVKEDPEIPQDFKNHFERDYVNAYDTFEKDVVELPGKTIENVSLTMPKMPSLLPDFSGLGKWLLIGGVILGALLILPHLFSGMATRRAVNTAGGI